MCENPRHSRGLERPGECISGNQRRQMSPHPHACAESLESIGEQTRICADRAIDIRERSARRANADSCRSDKCWKCRWRWRLSTREYNSLRRRNAGRREEGFDMGDALHGVLNLY